MCCTDTGPTLRRCPPLPASWQTHVEAAARHALLSAEPLLPARYAERARRSLETWLPLIAERPRVLTHGDLWLGNLLTDDRGNLTGLLDFDRMALAPPDRELDMLVRFWRYPWSFVPPEWEQTYVAALDFSDIAGIVRYCSAGLARDELAARLGVMELAYRLDKVARFGWSETMGKMLNTVLEGRWCEGLTLA